jgi:hypothetical protein
MLASEKRTIDELEFEVSQLPVKDARAMLVRLTRVIGPALTEFAKDGATSLGDIDHTTVAGAFGKLATTLTEEDLEYLCAKFGTVSKVRVGNLMLPVDKAGDTVFSGRLTTMFKWLWFAVEVNYSDFLGGLRDMSGLLSAGPKASPSTSPTA